MTKATGEIIKTKTVNFGNSLSFDVAGLNKTWGLKAYML
jgi:hypothetical protein